MGDLVLGQIAVVLAFTVIGGWFAAAEIALVSLRPGQVSKLAATGRRGQRVERLLQQPNRFLSAVQIGITLATTLSSAFGAVTFAAPVSDLLDASGLSTAASDTLALLLVTAVISYITLVIGELAPKRLALQRAESIALVASGPLEFIAQVARPVIWLLGVSTNVVVRMLGLDPRAGREEMTEQELRDIVASNDQLTSDERRLIAEVLDAGDRPIREVMVPRLDVHALPADLTTREALEAVRTLPNSRYPVVEGGLDDVAGFVHVRDLYAAVGPGAAPSRLRDLVRPVMRIPDSRRALPALAEMRKAGAHLAVVVDEYGGGAGIVTLEDLLEELVGDITDEFDETLAARRRSTGPTDGAPRPLPTESVDAQLRLDEFEEETGLRLPDGPYDTAAGWMLYALGRIPAEGDHARHGDIVLTVTQLRGRRVEQVRLSRAPGIGPGTGAGPTGNVTALPVGKGGTTATSGGTTTGSGGTTTGSGGTTTGPGGTTTGSGGTTTGSAGPTARPERPTGDEGGRTPAAGD